MPMVSRMSGTAVHRVHRGGAQGHGILVLRQVQDGVAAKIALGHQKHLMLPAAGDQDLLGLLEQRRRILQVPLERHLQAQHIVAGQGDVQVAELVEDIQHGVAALEDQLSQKGLLLQQKALLLHAAVLLEPPAGLVHRGGEGLLRGGLEDKVHHRVLDGLLGVFKVREAGQEDQLGVQLMLPDPAAQLEPVHLGHPDVRDQDVRRGLPDLPHRVRAVIGHGLDKSSHGHSSRSGGSGPAGWRARCPLSITA